MIGVQAEAGVLRRVADTVRPRSLMRPSEWAERHIVLSREQTESRPGRFSCAWKPWTRSIHDCLFDEPAKAGVICVKPARVGFSRAIVNVIGCLCDTAPDLAMFLINNKDNAAFWATEHFDKMLEQVEHLGCRFEEAATDRRETTLQRPFTGGRVDFAGAGTAGSVISRGYARIFLDEYEAILDEFPVSKWGSPFVMAETRLKEARDRSQLWVWSHPRKQGDGIDDLASRLGDERHWVWDCPHCGETIVPSSSMIKMATDESGQLLPETAVCACPHCGASISDAERAVAVWPPELGGTGRFETGLDPEIAGSRRYIGLRINGLSDPYSPLRELASGRARCRSESELMAFLNTGMGEPYTPASAVITEALVRERLHLDDRFSVPGGERGAVLCTMGVDVQAPEANPTLYGRLTGWTINGHAFVRYVKLGGWAALQAYLQDATVPLDDGTYLTPRVCSIDCGAFTGQVLDFCRGDMRSVPGGHPIMLLPLRFQPHVKSTQPALLPSEAKRIDPKRPYLGPQLRYDLHRHSWVDREMRRWTDGRITVVGVATDELPAHVTANVLEPVRDVHGWGTPDLEWVRMKGRRDDYAMAGAYDEAGAVLTQHLDDLRVIAAPPVPKPSPDIDGVPRNRWLGRERNRKSWFGR